MLAQLPQNDIEISPRLAVDSPVSEVTGDRQRNDVLEVALEVDTSFWSQAACAVDGGALAHLFFSEELLDIADAKRICAGCPVLEPCLEGALARKEPQGVWGGQLFSNGKVLASKRRRGRPPKNPRPEDEFVHVEVPVSLQHIVERRTA
ncbi:MAG TPA: WhiB family transcriptional regulator [Acidimicrobiales bacterium]|jgi:WhiB family redox-sensing transcriptional regulator|nr:WhiB family transcriptional regulator [Acidimicrobiales bacterium]